MLKQFKQKFGFWVVLLVGLAFEVPLWGGEGDFKDPADDLKLPEVVARINETEIKSEFIKFKINSVLKAMKRQAGGTPTGLSKVKKIEMK